MKLYSFFVLTIWVNFLTAQNTKARIESIPKNGFYKILIPSEIRSYSKEDLSDFRILDAQSKEIPYFLTTDVPERTVEQFEAFTIISKVSEPKKSTTIEIENPKAEINGLRLVIANSEVTKTYNISGSNDRTEWFGLVNDGILSDLKSDKTLSIAKEITLPLCSYRFLKITFNDSTTLPINVLKIGNTNAYSIKGIFQEIKTQNIETVQNTAEKKTFIKVKFDYPQFIDKLVFKIDNSSLFKRNARIYTEKDRIEKHKAVKYEEDIAHFALISNQANTFEIDRTQQEHLIIEIDNQDNPPLQISDIQFYQKPIYAIADLKSNDNYTVTTGSPSTMSPQYDLAYFKESISSNLPETNIVSIEHTKSEITTNTDNHFWQKSWFMWLCISIAGLMIAFFSMRLIKEV